MADYETLVTSVIDGDEVQVKELTKALINAGFKPLDIINQGLIAAMDIVGPRFRDGEMFVPEVLMAAKSMATGIEILKPFMSDTDMPSKGKIVLGTVKGDLHDIGKNLVGMMLESSGFQVINLGIDISPAEFVAAIKKHKPGIIAMSAFLVLKSRHRIPVALLTVVAAAALVSFMPQQYWQRMESINNYEEDRSAMGRINVWHTAVNIANDRVTGAGFNYYKPKAFARYAPEPKNIHSSHSIYFQALGEHGWIGLGLFLYFWAYVWFKCRQVIACAGDDDEGRSRALLARMIQVSLTGFAVGGAFVNIGNWDMTYYLAIVAVATARITKERAQTFTAPRVENNGGFLPARQTRAPRLARGSTAR